MRIQSNCFKKLTIVLSLGKLLAEHERDGIRERTMAGLASARARGRNGGRPKVLTEEKKALAFETLQNGNKSVKGIAKGLRAAIPDGNVTY